MTGDHARPITFSVQFDRAIAACARAQMLVTRAAEAAAQSREMRRSSRRVRRHVVETREAWKGADVLSTLMRRQVTGVAGAMRKAGLTQEDATATIRAHIRFVLYDGGLREREAEPVVLRAESWIAEIFQAA